MGVGLPLPDLPGSLLLIRVRWGGAARAAAVVAGFAAFYALYFSPVIFSGGLLAPIHSDMPVSNLPAFFAPRPLWSPLTFSGFPLDANPPEMAWYPIVWLFPRVPGGWNAFLVTGYVLLASFMTGFLACATGSMPAGLFGGLVVGGSAFFLAHLAHPYMIHACAWVALLLWALERLRIRRDPRWLAAAAAAVALALLAGHPQFFVYGLGLAGAYVVSVGWTAPSGRWSYFAWSLGAVALGTALAGVLVLPAQELAAQSLRGEWTYESFTAFPMPSYQLPGLFFPYLFGGSPATFYRMPYFGRDASPNEMMGYVGAVPLLLAVAALGLLRAEGRVRFWAAAAGVALLLSLGASTPLARLFFHIPGYNKFRVPSRHLFEYTFALASLASFALADLVRRPIEERRRRIAGAGVWVGTGLLGLVILLLAIAGRFREKALEAAGVAGLSLLPWRNPALGVPLVLFAAGWAALRSWGRRPTGSRFALLLFVAALDLASFGWFYEWRTEPLSPAMIEMPSSLEGLKRELRTTSQRLVSFRGSAFREPESSPPEESRLWGIPNASGDHVLMLDRYSRMLDMDDQGALRYGSLATGNRSLDLLAVRYLTIPTPYAAERWDRDDSARVWTSGPDLSRHLGPACGRPYPEHLSFEPGAVEADGLVLVTSLECASGVPQGEKVLRVTVRARGGTPRTFHLEAGRDTAELGWERPDLRRSVRHSMGRAIDNTPSRDAEGVEYLAHHYVTELDLPEGTVVEGIDLEREGGAGRVSVLEVTLHRTPRGGSPPMRRVHELGEAGRWVHARDLGRTSIYENRRALPRAWVVSRTRPLGAEAILRAIRTSVLPDGTPFDPTKEALVEEPLETPPGGGDPRIRLQDLHVEDTSVTLSVETDREAFLVASDVFYPGWRAAVDGRETRIFRTDYVLRGIALPPGSHEVRFEYRPRSVRLGAGLSALGLVGLLVLLLRGGPKAPRGEGAA